MMPPFDGSGPVGPGRSARAGAEHLFAGDDGTAPARGVCDTNVGDGGWGWLRDSLVVL
ncbi:Protein of unknown function [Mycobacterium canettii CIPT 140070017]|nr:Protein of unknown function [Mycobacterium canettii CIPT 140070017]